MARKMKISVPRKRKTSLSKAATIPPGGGKAIKFQKSPVRIPKNVTRTKRAGKK